MTGYFIRIMRAGRPESVEIDQLTDQELDKLFATCTREVAARWAKCLAIWIRDNIIDDPADVQESVVPS